MDRVVVDVVAESAVLMESHGVAQEPHEETDEADEAVETSRDCRASRAGTAVEGEDMLDSVSVAALIRYTTVVGLVTPEKTYDAPAAAETVVRVGDAHVVRFAASHASMAYATTSLDALAVHARVISLAPVRRA